MENETKMLASTFEQCLFRFCHWDLGRIENNYSFYRSGLKLLLPAGEPPPVYYTQCNLLHQWVDKAGTSSSLRSHILAYSYGWLLKGCWDGNIPNLPDFEAFLLIISTNSTPATKVIPTSLMVPGESCYSLEFSCTSCCWVFTIFKSVGSQAWQPLRCRL